MAGILVVADQKNGKFRQVIFELLGEGKKIAQHLGEELQAVVLGKGIAESSAPLADAGADRIFLVDDASLENYTTDGFSKALVKLIRQEKPSLVLLPHNAVGKDLAPAIAQKLGTGQISDVVDIDLEQGIRFKRPIYAGKALVLVSFTESAAPGIVTIRPKVFEPAVQQAGQAAKVVAFAAGIAAGDIRQIVRDVVRKASTRVELTEADVVISGGRGMKSAENFKILEELADVLGAAIGATRASVDEGWMEPQYQVGQTGKVVSPTLYIACGISGAIQHLAGMSSSKYIVAINTDPEAEIFKVADYGIVGDLFAVVPVLTREFQKTMAQRAS
jgi:electron transfer flavoprotein alpha subunit